MMIRVVWKETNAKGYKPVKYRKHEVKGHEGGGWVTDIEGDNNIYKNHYCALNAIDAHLGDYGQKGDSKRKNYGIQIIGTINKEE